MSRMPDLVFAKPRLAPGFRLRHDRTASVLYRCSAADYRFQTLTPLEAAVAPLLNGVYTMAEIAGFCREVFGGIGGDGSEITRALNGFGERLRSGDGILVDEGDCSPSVAGSGVPSFPDFRNYQSPCRRLDRPLKVSIAFTNRCACRCQYCYAERRPCPEVPLDSWRRVFDELSANEIFVVDVAGGDLFQRRDAMDLLAEMAGRGFVFLVSTKSLIGPDQAARLAEMGIGRRNVPDYLVRRVQVSLDSVDGETAARLAGRPGYLAQAEATVKNLVRAGISPRIKGVLTALNADAPAGIVARLADLGVTEFQFAQYGRSKFRHRDELFLARDQKLRLRDLARELALRHPGIAIAIQDDLSTGGPRNLSPDQWRERALCSGGRSEMTIQPNGDVTLCDQVPHAEKYVTGNVFEEGVLEVWRSPVLLAFLYPPREKFAGSVCFECPDFDECHQGRGYCYRDTLSSYGTIYDAQPECPRQDKIPAREV